VLCFGAGWRGVVVLCFGGVLSADKSAFVPVRELLSSLLQREEKCLRG
jgi:hypothetical protein